MFPSPYGDFVFQHYKSSDDLLMFHQAFPSPYGDFVFQQRKENLFVRGMEIVSVPLRGFCFSTLDALLKASDYFEFPSPYGDFVFQHWL